MKEPTTTTCRADQNGTGSAMDGENRKNDVFKVSVQIRAGSAKGGKNRETLADIIAEMRKDCPARHMDGTRYHDGDWVYTKGTVKKLADRIEAASKLARCGDRNIDRHSDVKAAWKEFCDVCTTQDCATCKFSGIDIGECGFNWLFAKKDA